MISIKFITPTNTAMVDTIQIMIEAFRFGSGEALVDCPAIQRRCEGGAWFEFRRCSLRVGAATAAGAAWTKTFHKRLEICQRPRL
jgi:hypothetical protein